MEAEAGLEPLLFLIKAKLYRIYSNEGKGTGACSLCDVHENNLHTSNKSLAHN